MNLGFAPETANGPADLDPKAEFTEGLKLAQNDYPQKALERLQRAYECDRHNPYYISFSDCRWRVWNGSRTRRRSFAKWRFN